MISGKRRGGRGRLGSVAGMLSADEPPLNDLTDEQIQKLLGEVAPKV
ncbi:hypothetical protein [Streptomyces sp. NPDC059906]